jgi:hypothetical protein
MKRPLTWTRALVARDFNLSPQELFMAKYEHNIKKYYNK